MTTRKLAMSHPLVKNIRKGKYQSADVYIGRPSKWGNPFVLDSCHSHDERLEVIEKYRAWLQSQLALLAALPELKGKTLGCWCAPLPCHGDVLAELANKENDNEIGPNEKGIGS